MRAFCGKSMKLTFRGGMDQMIKIVKHTPDAAISPHLKTNQRNDSEKLREDIVNNVTNGIQSRTNHD